MQQGKILGVEFSGTVEELGSQSEGSFKTGDEVFGLAYGGASPPIPFYDIGAEDRWGKH